MSLGVPRLLNLHCKKKNLNLVEFWFLGFLFVFVFVFQAKVEGMSFSRRQKPCFVHFGMYADTLQIAMISD